MKSDTITVRQIFQERRQYCVPFYQRTYVWDYTDQWWPLWEDIRDKAEARLSGGNVVPHFLGAIVLEPQKSRDLKGVDAYHIIDGQQRLTTLQFLIKAARMMLSDRGDGSYLSVLDGVLANANPETMRNERVEKYKLWPTFKDQDSYIKAMSAAALPELKKLFPDSFTQHGTLRKIGVEHPPAFLAIWSFYDFFKKWVEKEDAEVSERSGALVSAILQDLKLVTIILEEEDDAQVIFETLNGRGAELHATDLIRNYIFMRAGHGDEDSAMLYKDFWVFFESEYWSQSQRRGRIKRPRLEWLLHSSLQAEVHDDVDLARLYFEYRKYVGNKIPAMSAEQQLVMLRKYASHYQELVSGSAATPVSLFGQRIQAYDITTIYPLALMVSMADISGVEKEQIYSYLASYIVRRAVCGLTHKNYNNVFMSLLRSLAKAGVSVSTLVTALGGLSGDATRWPSDNEFKSAILSNPLYPGFLDAAKMRSMLSELERGLRAEARIEDAGMPSLERLDIDHIMPQSWFAHWPLTDGSKVTKEELKDASLAELLMSEASERDAAILDRNALIPTLGNLTLLNLSVNREAQNREFPVKKNLLIQNTSLRLNVPLVALDGWDEGAIRRRGMALADMAIRIWPRP